MVEIRPGAGMLDTSVLIAAEHSARLPAEIAISSLSLAELTAGLHATAYVTERGRRQERLQMIEAMFDPLPFDAACARAYGRVHAAIAQAGRMAHRTHVLDLGVAATAAAHDLPLYTHNAAALHALGPVLEIVDCVP